MRILLTSIGSFGDLNPYIGLGLALERRGHKAVLAVSKFYRDAVEAAGLECRPVRPDGDPSDRTVVEKIMDPLMGADFLIRQLLMPRLDEAYEDLARAATDADVIVSHPLTFAAPLVAARLDRLWTGAVLAPVSFFSQADPPILVAHPAAAVFHRHWPALSKWPLRAGKIVTRSWGDPVQALRRRLGLPSGGHPMYQGQFSPHLNLALFSRVLAAPQADWPPHTVVTGSVSYDAVHGGMPAALAKFLDDGPAPVVFTLGSSAVSVAKAPAFYKASAAAASQLGLRAVLLVGKSDGVARATASANVFVADWAPHSELFPRAAAVVHQGGAGTLHTALAAGHPTVVVPFAHDQPDNAARLERLGVSRTIYPQRYSAGRVAAALKSLLADPDVRRRAQAAAEVVGTERGADSAAAALEALASGLPQPFLSR